MLTAYLPSKVREAQNRTIKILAAIETAKSLGFDNETICKHISEIYGITKEYAMNYIKSYEEDEAEKMAEEQNMGG